MKRIVTILAFFILSFLIAIVGILTPLSAQALQDNSNELEQVRQSLKDMNVWQVTAAIFENNFMITLIMFIPFAGPAYGLYTMYNTGLVAGAYASVNHLPGVMSFLLLFILPDTWLEFAAYSTAMASSVWLVWRIIQRRGKRELSRTGMFIVICAGMLLLGALIEAYLNTLIA